MDSAEYFDSYGDLEIHKLMLEDSVRNKVYKQAVEENKEQFAGKTVLDVGAGSGILSIYCAQAGAATVYAVEASETYKLCTEIVQENGFDNIIKVHHSKIEDFVLPNNAKVDIIISEWMGFYLLHEGMLDSVIFARDHFLKQNGLIFPEYATLYAVPCSLPSMFEKWDNIDGVSMKAFGKHLRTAASRKPEICTVEASHLIAGSEVILWVDLKDITSTDLDEIKIKHLQVATSSSIYQSICLWFTCTFPSSNFEPVILSTDPQDTQTHWKQTAIVLPTSVRVERKEPIAYEISLKRDTTSGNSRRYNIELEMLDPDLIEHPEYCTCYKTKCILAKAVLKQFEMQQ